MCSDQDAKSIEHTTLSIYEEPHHGVVIRDTTLLWSQGVSANIYPSPTITPANYSQFRFSTGLFFPRLPFASDDSGWLDVDPIFADAAQHNA